MDHIYTFLTTQGHGGPLRKRDQLNSGATSEITRTRKTIYTIHAPINSNKVNMKGWLWRPNVIRGLWATKASWHLSYRWGKNTRKYHTQETCPVQDRTRSRCVTGAHATACSTAVDYGDTQLNFSFSWTCWLLKTCSSINCNNNTVMIIFILSS